MQQCNKARQSSCFRPRKQLASVAFLISAALLTSCAAPGAEGQETARTANTIQSIYWSDGDSGRIDGVPFRLKDVDAPETGGVGAAVGPAQCELERERGFKAKEFAVEFTRDKQLTITRKYGQGARDRLLIDLSADGEDIGRAGLASGNYKPWPHDGSRALAPRPDWCD